MKRKDEGRFSTDEIEVTPEMIEAGVSVLCGYETLTAGAFIGLGKCTAPCVTDCSYLGINNTRKPHQAKLEIYGQVRLGV